MLDTTPDKTALFGNEPPPVAWALKPVELQASEVKALRRI
jgi:hypothetical protein